MLGECFVGAVVCGQLPCADGPMPAGESGPQRNSAGVGSSLHSRTRPVHAGRGRSAEVTLWAVPSNGRPPLVSARHVSRSVAYASPGRCKAPDRNDLATDFLTAGPHVATSVTYTAVLDVKRSTTEHLAGLLRDHRIAARTHKGRRCFEQAVHAALVPRRHPAGPARLRQRPVGLHLLPLPLRGDWPSWPPGHRTSRPRWSVRRQPCSPI